MSYAAGVVALYSEGDGGIGPGDRVRARNGSFETLVGVVREVVGIDARVEYDVFARPIVAEIAIGELERV